MLDLLKALRKHCTIGYVSGSDMVKQREQLGRNTTDVITLFDYCFSENGLTSYKLGEPLPSTSFIKKVGEEPYKEMVKFILHYIADLDIPIKRGTFVEFRAGMINVSPIGRNASMEERNDFEQYDLEHGVRKEMVRVMREKFGHLGLT